MQNYLFSGRISMLASFCAVAMSIVSATMAWANQDKINALQTLEMTYFKESQVEMRKDVKEQFMELKADVRLQFNDVYIRLTDLGKKVDNLK